MTVTADYAQTHLQELLAATEKGEQVNITREDGFAVALISIRKSIAKDRSGLFGAMKGKMWMADDWDSPETNAEIARSFNESELFPPEL